MSAGGNPNSNMPRNQVNSVKQSTDSASNPISNNPNPAGGMSMNTSGSNNNNNRSNYHHHHHNNHSGSRNNHHNRQNGNGNGSGRRGGENLNHLLGFQLAPRARPPTSAPRRGTRKSTSVPFNKERYVNAQYRFLVKPTGDYTACFADADIFLNWSDILQVIIPTTTALSSAATSSTSSSSSLSRHRSDHEGNTCPICLSKPTAPRMTKCGHVFCYPCILHYLSHDTVSTITPTTQSASIAERSRISRPGAENARPIRIPTYQEPTPQRSGRAWKRCPICWDSVYSKDLKAVRWFDPSDVAREHEEERDFDKELDQQKQKQKQKEEDEDISGKLEDVEHQAVLSSIVDSSSSTSTSKLQDLIGPLLSMRLIERPILTTLALPKSSTWPPPSSAFSPSNSNPINISNPYPVIIPPHSAPWHFQPDVLPFAKFMLATPELLLDSLNQDLDSLQEEKASLRSMAEMTRRMGGVVDDESIAYAQLAEDKVKDQMEKVKMELDVESVKSSIGKAKNDLKEFKEILRESRSGMHERRRNVSRKQLKKEKEREKNQRISSLEEEKDSVGETSNGEAQEEKSSEDPEISEGMEQFLALKSQGLGGSYSSPLNNVKPQEQSHEETSESDANKSQESRSTPQPRTRRNLNPPSPSPSSYLFYQASSGQPIYLNPLDIKILQSEYKSYSNFPENLQVKVSGSDEGSVNDELRKKHKYLSHLPMAADLVFVEVDWEAMIQGEEKIREEIRSKELSSSESQNVGEDRSHHFKPVISRHTLSQYENALRQRKNKRKDRSRREDKARSKAEGGDGFNGQGLGQSQGGANAREIREAQLKVSLDGDPELGRSFGSRTSSSLGGNESDFFGRSPRSENGFNQINGHSPSFREQALWGAERHFEIHPGGNGNASSSQEDFPDALHSHSHSHQDSGNSPLFKPQNPGATSGLSSMKKTVWGTQSFSNHHRQRDGFEDPDMDEAWFELEEDYIVGNKSGNLKEGRGLNKQSRASSNPSHNHNHNHNHNFNSNSNQGSSSTSSNGGKDQIIWGPSKDVEQRRQETESDPNTTSGMTKNLNQNKKKKVKKLVLTSGGRGTG